MSDVNIELACAKKWREPLFQCGNLRNPWVHLLDACRMLFPAGCAAPFVIHRWTEEHALDWTTRNFCITWGAASTSKSNDYGLFALLDWSTDPHETYTIIASTSKAMLEVRSYESVMRYFQYLKAAFKGQWPGKRSRQRLAIVNESDEDDADPLSSVKASIKGVAVQDGTEQESRAQLQGGHLPYVRMIGDELSQMRAAFMAARFNLRMGSRDFRFFGLCNPDDFNDLAAQHSVPVDGWASVNENSVEWISTYGWVRHHNGFDSPAIVEPDGEAKYPFLINRTHIAESVRDAGGDEDHPQIWTMVRGWPPPQGISRTVISQKMFVAYRMGADVEWRSMQHAVGFLDPAYTGDGDACVFMPGRVGYSIDGLLTLSFLPAVQFKIKAASEKLITEQITDQLREQMQHHGIAEDLVGVDDSGIQNIGDAIDRALRMRVYRMQNNVRASDLPVSAANPQLSRERYKDQITEAHYSLRLFAEAGQIRGLGGNAASDIWNRRVVDNKYPFRVESKKEFKARHKHSPDHGDAAVGVVQLCRHRLGFYPGATVFAGAQIESSMPSSVLSDPGAVAYDLDAANRGHYGDADD